jgi:hypothetical protein
MKEKNMIRKKTWLVRIVVFGLIFNLNACTTNENVETPLVTSQPTVDYSQYPISENTQTDNSSDASEYGQLLYPELYHGQNFSGFSIDTVFPLTDVNITNDGLWQYSWINRYTLQIWQVNDQEQSQLISIPESDNRSIHIYSQSPDGTAIALAYSYSSAHCLLSPIGISNIVNGIWQEPNYFLIDNNPCLESFNWTGDSQYLFITTTGNALFKEIFIFNRQMELVHEVHVPTITEHGIPPVSGEENYSYIISPDIFVFADNTLIVEYLTPDNTKSFNISDSYFFYQINADEIIPITTLHERFIVLGISPDEQYLLLGSTNPYPMEIRDHWLAVLEIGTGEIVDRQEIDGWVLNSFSSDDRATTAITEELNNGEYHLLIWNWGDNSFQDLGGISALLGWYDTTHGYSVVIRDETGDAYLYGIQP